MDTAGYDENLDRSIETDSLSEIEERTGYSYEELADFIGGGNNASFSSTIAFSATDEDTVAWTSGTISFASGLTTATISSGNTGNISARTYIYWNPEIEVTLQSTTTVSEAVKGGRTLLAIATNNADTNGKTQIDTFGTSGSYPSAVSTTHLEAGVMTVPLVMTPASDTTALVVVNQNDGTNIFTVDSTNARVGIANTAPATPLDVFGNSTTQALRLRGLGDSSSSGAKSPTYTQEIGWSSSGNLRSSDNSYMFASVAAAKAQMEAWIEFNELDNVFNPLGAVEILGIKVTVEAKKDSGISNAYHDVALTSNYDEYPSEDWTTDKGTGNITDSDVVYTLGGETDLWGRAWTSPNDFVWNKFQVRVVSHCDQDAAPGSLYIDHITVTVYYTPSTPVPSTTKIADFYVGSDGSLVADLTSGNSTSQFFDFRSEDDEYGLILRESDGTGTTVLANFYVVDATPDYLSINLGTTDTNALNITSGDDIGFGTATPIGKLEIKQEISTGTITPSMVITSVAHTALTASTERTEVNFNLSATQQFATGALTTQRAMRIQAPTYAFVGASTITNAYTVEISGAPIAGTNATITNSYALAVGGKTLLSDKVIFTQVDGNEYIDSLADGYLDIGATTAIRMNGIMLATDAIYFTQTDGNEFVDSLNDGYLDLGATTGIRINNFIRHTSASYRRYYHLPMSALDPGASGATWVDPSANSLGGWNLDVAGEVLFTVVDVHADWDGASDMEVELYFAINDATTVDTNTADIKLVAYYNATGDTATKTQTIEVATVTDGTQWKVYNATFTLDWDATDNVIEAGDQMMLCFNLETDTSEVDSILITAGSFYYNTTHIGIESGDT